MSASGTLLLASGVAAKKVIENIVTDLYTLAKSEGAVVLKKWKASHHIDSVYKKTRSIRLVKTILQPERAVDLSAFYHPSKVEFKSKRVTIKQIDDFECDGNILIEGTVGQGKSIFLRYLASVELFNSKLVPAFIELRRMRPGLSLMTLILEELKALGFDIDEKLFEVFASKGRIVLFLDAFDEVKDDIRQQLLEEIELLSRRFESLRIVVTSRPNCGISASPLFRVFRLSTLRDREYEQVVTRLAHDEPTANAIIQGIRKESAQVARLLTAPLMVALLLIRYRIDQSLPHNDASFYEALFSLLLQRHDKSKGGYVRPRKSNLSDTSLEQCFNALSYLTRKADESSFSRSQLIKHTVNAIKLAGHSASVDNLLADIIEITCLIVTDGEECRFIHKSVQEYHAAVFVRDQPDNSAIAFYRAMDTRWRLWMEELRFLSVIDRYRFLKHFHCPQIRRLTKLSGPIEALKHLDINKETILQCCGGDKLSFIMGRGESKGFAYSSSSLHWPIAHIIHYEHERGYSEEFFKFKLSDMTGINVRAEGNETFVTVRDLLASDSCKARAELACNNLFTALLLNLRESEEFVASVERRTQAFHF